MRDLVLHAFLKNRPMSLKVDVRSRMRCLPDGFWRVMAEKIAIGCLNAFIHRRCQPVELSLLGGHRAVLLKPVLAGCAAQAAFPSAIHPLPVHGAKKGRTAIS